MGATVKVRIAVAVDPKGRWVASGWSGDNSSGPESHNELLEMYDDDTIGPSERFFWLTAELPLPTIDEVPAESEEAS